MRDTNLILPIDFSLFAGEEAYGRIYGPVQFTAMPSIGDRIFFPLIIEEVGEDSNKYEVEIFLDPIVIIDKIFSIESGSASASLSLDDVIVKNRTEAAALMRNMERVHGLFCDTYAL